MVRHRRAIRCPRGETRMTQTAISVQTRSFGGQLWRYGATGLINTGIGLVIIFALHLGLGLGVTLSNAVGYGVGLLISFALNRSWTFASDANLLMSGLKYATLIGVAFAACLLLIGSVQAAGFSYFIAQIMGTTLYSALVFLGARYVVFTS